MIAQLVNDSTQLSSHFPRRILLVEDNDVNRMLMSDYLDYLKYEVESLSDATTFFATVDKFQPDLILLDLKLPEIDGYQVLEQIQQKPKYSKIPIIIVSAFAFKSDQEKAMSLGAIRYFVKPVNLTELVLVIEEVLANYCK